MRPGHPRYGPPSRARFDELLIMEAMLRHLQGRYDDEVRLDRGALDRRPEDTLVRTTSRGPFRRASIAPRRGRTSTA